MLPVHVLNTCILMQNRFDNLTVKVVFKDILTRDKNELSANTLSWRCTPWVGHQIRKMDVSNSLWKRSVTSIKIFKNNLIQNRFDKLKLVRVRYSVQPLIKQRCKLKRMLLKRLVQSGISLNLRTGPTGYAPLFNQWDGALVFINMDNRKTG